MHVHFKHNGRLLTNYLRIEEVKECCGLAIISRMPFPCNLRPWRTVRITHKTGYMHFTISDEEYLALFKDAVSRAIRTPDYKNRSVMAFLSNAQLENGVADVLKELGFEVTGSKIKNPNYANKERITIFLLNGREA